jgi:hypothetical protein
MMIRGVRFCQAGALQGRYPYRYGTPGGFFGTQRTSARLKRTRKLAAAWEER